MSTAAGGPAPGAPGQGPGRSLPLYIRLAGALVVAMVVLVANHVMQHSVRLVPPLVGEGVNAAIALGLGMYLSRILERAVRGPHAHDLRRAAMIRLLLRLVLYVLVLVAVLGSFGVDLGSLAFGGAFLTVIIGLAGQTVFSNLLAGIVLVIAHPFEVGDRVSIMSWQFPMMPPTYPHEAIPTAYEGVVTDLNLVYTFLRSDERVPLIVPNSIVASGMIKNHARTSAKRARLRFDVDMALPTQTVLEMAREAVDFARRSFPGIAGEANASVVDLTPTTYAVAIHYLVDPADEEASRARVYARMVEHLRDLVAGAKAAGQPEP